jgi:hypothetical protein
LETVASSSGLRLSFIETQWTAAAESKDTQIREDRVRALMKFFHTALVECAEDVADKEIAPIDGTPAEPSYDLREDSLYYAYHLARKTGYADFSAEQRKVLKGLVLRTAFETMVRIAMRLQIMSEHEVDLVLCPKGARDIEHPLHQPDIEGHGYWDEELPSSLTKYEY